MTRLFVVFFLILSLLAACSPQVHREANRAWVQMRPSVVQVMDGLYATIRNFVAGNESKNGIDNNPPTDYDRIITMGHEIDS